MTDIAARPTLTAEEVHSKMRQIRTAKSRIAEEIATCNKDRDVLLEELRLVDEHQERVTKDDREFCGRLERELEAHLLNLRATDDRIKSIATPWGDVTSRVQQPEFRRDDVALMEWVQSSAPAFLRTKTTRSLAWDELKAKCHVRDNRLVTPVGEVVPGVEVIERPLKIEVQVTP